MKLTRLLVQLGLVHERAPEKASPAEEPAPLSTVVLSLEDLRARALDDQVRQEATELGLEKSWEEIYREQGLGEPPGGVCLEELDRKVQGLSEDEARVLVLGILKEKGAPIREVLLDGQSRDEALDAYEILLEKRVALRRAALEQRMDELNREVQALQARSADLQAALEAWKQRKREEEDLMELLGGMLARVQEQESKAGPSGPGTGSAARP